MNLESRLNKALKYSNGFQIENVFEDIYYNYYKLIYFILRKKIKLKEDVEELTNDTFVSFFNSLSRTSKIKSIKNLLITICNNKATDYLKKKKIITSEFDDALSYEIDVIPYDDYFTFLEKKLSAEEYYILIHHVVYEETFKEIAFDKHESINTIKSKYRRLIKKLKGENYEIK